MGTHKTVERAWKPTPGTAEWAVSEIKGDVGGSDGDSDDGEDGRTGLQVDSKAVSEIEGDAADGGAGDGAAAEAAAFGANDGRRCEPSYGPRGRRTLRGNSETAAELT